MRKISIIIPAYNCAQYLPQALNSALNQDYPELEIMVIDDGSADTTKQVVDEYIKRYPLKIRYFYQNNRGPGAARNQGIREAGGDFIAFLDGDDEWLKNSLSARAEFLEKNPEVGLVFADYFIRNGRIPDQSVLKKAGFLPTFSNAVNSKSNEGVIFNRRFYNQYLSFKPYPVWTGTVMLRKDITKKIGLFREDLRVGEDKDFWLRIAGQYPIGFLDLPLAIYNAATANSLTKDKERYHLEQLNYLLSIYDGNGINKSLLRKKMGAACFSLGYLNFDIYRQKSSRQWFIKSIRYNPFFVPVYFYLMFSMLPCPLINYLRHLKRG